MGQLENKNYLEDKFTEDELKVLDFDANSTKIRDLVIKSVKNVNDKLDKELLKQIALIGKMEPFRVICVDLLGFKEYHVIIKSDVVWNDPKFFISDIIAHFDDQKIIMYDIRPNTMINLFKNHINLNMFYRKSNKITTEYLKKELKNG